MKNKDDIILNKILAYINELKDFIDGYNQKKIEEDKKL